MKTAKKRCKFCHRWYRPDPRTLGHQLSCGNVDCKKKRKREADKSWRIRNPGYGDKRKHKVRAWSALYPDYWKHYRGTHPEYAERERRRMRLNRLRVGGVAKQDAMRQIAVERLQSIQAATPATVAKQDGIDRRVDGVIDYLIWREGVAKPNDIDRVAPAGVE